jgi:predicted SpoU family rRNA methylase
MAGGAALADARAAGAERLVGPGRDDEAKARSARCVVERWVGRPRACEKARDGESGD